MCVTLSTWKATKLPPPEGLSVIFLPYQRLNWAFYKQQLFLGGGDFMFHKWKGMTYKLDCF